MNILETNIFSTNSDRISLQRKEYISTQASQAKEINTLYDFGYDYFDNELNGFAYSGYHYDGRYAEVAKKIFKAYGLSNTSSILEVGCAKGYLLKEFSDYTEYVHGIEYSKYAISKSHRMIKDKIINADCSSTNIYNDKNMFDLIVCKETLPHLPLPSIKLALKNFNTWVKSPENILLQIQVVCNEAQASSVLKFDPTHKTLLDSSDWISILNDCNFQGSVHFKKLFNDN